MTFVPEGQKGLLLRTPLTYGFTAPAAFTQPKAIYSKEDAKIHTLGQKDQDILMKNKMDTLAFYTRNNPHPFRVRHMKGLLDSQICSVEDQVEPRYLLSPPTGQDFGAAFRPQGSTRYSANINKQLPAVGVVPVTTAWRDELEKKTQNAILRALGKSLPSRGGLDSQSGKRKRSHFEDLHDEKLLEWLCRILQTDSVPACQAWLSSATESEKEVVLNMIKMVACGEIQVQGSAASSPRPYTSDSQNNVWVPGKSQNKAHVMAPKNPTIYEDEEFNFPSLEKKDKGDKQMGGMCEIEEKIPNFPESDNIIRTALTLSRQSSRRGQHSSGPHGVFGKRQNEGGMEILMKKWREEVESREDKVHTHRRSSSHNSTPLTSSHAAKSSALQRVRSLTVPTPTSGGAKRKVQQPPPPVKVSVTKEVIHSNSGTPRLRYTSHWDKQGQ